MGVPAAAIMEAASQALNMVDMLINPPPTAPTVASGGKGQRIINPIQLQLLDTTPGIQNLFRLLNTEEQKRKKATLPGMLGGTDMISPFTGG